MKKIWLLSINMGYGHQRTAFALRELSGGEIINANDYPGIPQKDLAIWQTTRRTYEFISRFKRIPLIGKLSFAIFDKFQKITNFYPKRDLSKPNFTLRQMYSLFKKGFGRDLIEKLKSQPIPLISTFFTPAFMAEFFGFKGEIFVVVCDADIARTWAPLFPRKSKIKYFAPNQRVVQRLELYGVKKENIFLTGYPLPKELVGSLEKDALKENLKKRLLNLDPQKKFLQKYKDIVQEKLGPLPPLSDHPLTIMFSVGGAGAQKEIGIKILNSFLPGVRKGKVRIILSAGIRKEVRDYFLENIAKLSLGRFLGKSIRIIYEKEINSYFQSFNSALKETDVLWTKPSELSFYSALGLPIIIAPPIGSQEDFNEEWLLNSGFGKKEKNLNCTREWFFDWLNNGFLAEHAFQAFLEGDARGFFKIKEIINNVLDSR